MTPVKIVLLLRLSVKDQPFANKDMNLKNVTANEKSLSFHLSGLKFMQKHKSSFCSNSRLVMKTRAIFVIYVLCLMGGIFFLVTLVVLTFLKTNIK